MKRKTIVSLLLFSLLLSMLLPLNGCTDAKAASDLMKGVKSKKVPATVDLSENAAAVTDFGVRLFQNSLIPGENTLISPLSVLCALAMTANGADGDTLAQMEHALGLSTEQLNNWLHAYLASYSRSEGGNLNLANSIWFSEDSGFSANPDFLQLNADYYDAELYRVLFDQAACNTINRWVSEHTDGMIEKILDEPPDAVMCLINALSFEAEWQQVYDEYAVHNEIFTAETGAQHNAELMYSMEYAYLEDENAVGFIKYYDNRDFAFVALLPNEGITVADYAASLTGEKLQTLLTQVQSTPVEAALPKFEIEFNAELRKSLETLGISDAFEVGHADFSRLGSSPEGPIYISQVLHKTFIEVGELGTKAGAATAITAAGGAAPNTQEPKSVILNRPFLYMLIDCKNNIPFFIGSMMGVTPSSDVIPSATLPDPEPIKFNARYVRTDGYHEDVEYPVVTLIRSVKELNAYYEANKDLYFMERRENPSSDSTPGFLDICDGYDDAFFETKALVLVLLEEGSGSIRHKVTDAILSPDGQLSVSIQSIAPEFGTCDMAEWHIFVEIPSDSALSDADGIEVIQS